jgi:hypothetical protein
LRCAPTWFAKGVCSRWVSSTTMGTLT